MCKRLLWVLAIVTFGGMSTIARADESADVKEAAMSFARWLSLGNAEQARKFAMPNESTNVFIELVAPLVAAETKLHDASVSKFGPGGSAITNGGTPAEVFNEYSKHPADLIVTLNGETASIVARQKEGDKQPPGQPLQLKKAEGKWKVDLADLLGADQIKQQAAQLQIVTRAMNDTADEIKAGKYATVRDAKVALAQKAMAARSAPRGVKKDLGAK
jgi:hypothetical protein